MVQARLTGFTAASHWCILAPGRQAAAKFACEVALLRGLPFLLLILVLAVALGASPESGSLGAGPVIAADASTPTATPSAGALPAPGSPARRLYDALNAERVRQGLTPVAWSTELGTAAALHSADMAANDFLDHDGSDGSDQQQRAARAGYLVPAGSGWMVIEAISAMPSMEAALDWLLTDGVHRRVLLRSTWREVGVGYVSGGRYGNYWTLDFGCRPNVLPVFAAPTADGKSLSLTFTNETCAAYGGGPDQMGRATELMVSTSSEFRDGAWEPFIDSKQVARPGGGLSVQLRDGSGRQSAAAHLVPDAMPVASSLAPPATATPAATATKSPTATPTASPTATRTPSPTATASPTPAATPTPEPDED